MISREKLYKLVWSKPMTKSQRRTWHFRKLYDAGLRPAECPLPRAWILGKVRRREGALTNFHTILTSDIYRRIAVRTILMAATVTLTNILLAFPFA